MPQGQNKPSKSGKKNPYFNPLKILRLPKTPKWKLGLGVAGVFLLLAILLFSREIGQLLDLIPTPAQKPGAPQITVTVEPFSQSGGPTDVRIYTLQTQIEHGTYFDAGNLEDPCNDICPLPFYGDIIYQVDDLVNQYPEFIESAVVTVPIENPEAFGNDPNQPRLTVLEDINTFGLFTNRRLSPEDLGFITTPPILTITLTDYALSEGGLTIPFEIQINANYLPSLGIHYVPPNDPPVMEDPDPAQGEIVLKGGLPPDFRVEVWERIEVSENVYECTDSKDIHAHWGENISYCVNVYSENDFEGWVDLSETDLAPYGGAEGEAGKYFVTPTPWIFPSSVYVTPDTPGTTKLLLVTQPDLMETVEFAPFPVYGTDTIVTREDYGNLYITPAISPTPDFTVEVSPTTHDNITWGSSADFIVYLASEEGFDGSIELSSLELANDWVDYVESYSFSEDIITLTPANDINNRVAVDLQIITRPVSYFEPDTPPTNQKVFFSVDGRDILGNIAYNPSKHSSYGEVTITYTIPLSDFYLEMEDPTGVEVQSSAGSAIYTIRVMREGYEGEIHLDALSWDTNHVGELLDSQTGINANLIETSTDDTWELTIAGDNTEFSRHYDFYIRGNALTPPPEEFRWAPNDEVNPYIQNSTPAYFRIQTTPGYDLEISSAQIISAGQVAEYTVRVTNPINGFSPTEPVLLTQDILNQNSDYLEGVWFEGNIQEITTSISDLDGVQVYLDTKEDVHISEPGFNFSINSTTPNIDPSVERQATSLLAINNFYLTMEPQTSNEWTVTESTGSATYTIRVVREGYEGEIHLYALSEDLNHIGEDLDEQSGISANLVETSIDDVWELTIAGDGSEFDRLYEFYIRGNATDIAGPTGYRWAPNDEVNPYIQNSTPAYFRIQTTPGYNIEITPDPDVVDEGGIGVFTVKIANPINGFSSTEPVLLTQDILNQNSDYLEGVWFEGNVQEITTSISDSDGVQVYLDTIENPVPVLPISLPFRVNGLSQVTNIAQTGTSNLVINPLPDPDFDLAILPPKPHDDIYWGEIANFTIELTSHGTDFAGEVVLTSSQLAGYLNSGYLTDYSFDGVSETNSITVSPSGSTLVNLQLITSGDITDINPFTMSFTVDGNSVGIPNQTYHRDFSSVTALQPPPDPYFTLTVTPPVHDPATIYWGENANFNVTLTSENGFDGNVNLTSVQLENFITNNYLTDYTFSGFSNNLTIAVTPANDINNPVLVPLQLLTAPDRADIDRLLAFTVAGTNTADSGDIKTGDAQVTVTAVPPDPNFTLQISPKPHDEIMWGENANFIITVETNETMSGEITVSSDELASYVTNGYLTNYTFNGNPNSTIVTVTPNSQANIDLQLLSVAERTDSQNLSFTVDGSSIDIPDSPTDHHDSSSVIVEPEPAPLDFEIFISPPYLETDGGGTVQYDINIVRDPGFTETVRLTENLLSDHSEYISQATFGITNLVDGVSDSTTLHVVTRELSEEQLVSFIVTGTALDNSPQHSTGADLQINVVAEPPPPPDPDFTINVSPDWQEVDAEDVAHYTVTVTPLNNFTDTVILTHNLYSDFDEYVSDVQFDELQLTQDNNYTTDMRITTRDIEETHEITFTITGTGVLTTLVRADDADLRIIVEDYTPPPSPPGGGTGPSPEPDPPTTGGTAPDYTIEVTPVTNTTLNPGQSATYLVTIHRSGSFNGPVTLTTDVLELNPDIASAIFDRTIIPSGENTTNLTLTSRSPAIDSNTIFNVLGSSNEAGDRSDEAPVAIINPLVETGPETNLWMLALLLAWFMTMGMRLELAKQEN